MCTLFRDGVWGCHMKGTRTRNKWSAFLGLAHQNRTIAIASAFRVDGAKSREISQKEGVLGSEIAARNRKSLAIFHRTLNSQCSIALSYLGNRAISGVRDGHRNRKSRKSLRFRCAKFLGESGGEAEDGPEKAPFFVTYDALHIGLM